MKISVANADPKTPLWLHAEVPEGSTVSEAIEASGVLQRCPGIDLSQRGVGIFGKAVKLDAPVKEGDRVEIYCPAVAEDV